MLKKIKNLIYDFYLLMIELWHLLLYLISSRTKKDKNIWVFGAWYGYSYSDNSKYLFEYVNQFQKHIKAVWLTRQKNIVSFLRSKGYSAYLFHDPLAFYYCTKAGVAIFCTGRIYDLPTPYLSFPTKFIQLWHGLGPKKLLEKEETFPRLKTVSYSLNHQNRLFIKIIIFLTSLITGKTLSSIKELPYNTENMSEYSLFITKSFVGKKKIEKLGVLSSEKIVITGYPRNDILLSKNIPDSPLIKQIKNYKKNKFKIAIYLPTFRESDNEKIFFKSFLSLKNLEKNLIREKLIILIKLHQKLKYVILDKHINLNIKNTLLLEEDDIYPILSLTDCLITDYSSIYTDYLLLDKPIIFFDWDRRRFAIERGFYYDYDRYTPGPKASSWADIINHIKNLTLLKQKYRKERLQLCNYFNHFKDTNNSQRVYQKIVSLFNIV